MFPSRIFPVYRVLTPAVAHLREHAVGADLRQRCVLVFQLFGAAVLRDPNRLYQARPPQLVLSSPLSFLL